MVVTVKARVIAWGQGIPQRQGKFLTDFACPGVKATFESVLTAIRLIADHAALCMVNDFILRKLSINSLNHF